MAGVLPESASDKASGSVFTEFMHLYICNSLERSGGYCEADENYAHHIYLSSLSYRVHCGQYAGVDDERGDHMYADKIYYWVKAFGFFLQHRIAPIPVCEIPKCVCPICRESDAPEEDGDKQKYSEHIYASSNRKRREDHGRLDAPIRVVDRCVLEYETENKRHDGCRYVCDQQ